MKTKQRIVCFLFFIFIFGTPLQVQAKVTEAKILEQTDPTTGEMLTCGIYKVDGTVAFCIDRYMISPKKGHSTSEWIAVDSIDLRKVLYYGYNGPKDQGFTIVETGMAAAEANGRGDNQLGRTILAKIQKLEAPPERFKVWKVHTNEGNTQDLAFYTMEEESVSMELVKYRENSTTPLQDAVFTHTLPDGTEENVVTDANGKITLAKLKQGSHKLVETNAPAGYRRNANEILFTVTDTGKIQVNSVVNETYGAVRWNWDDKGNLMIEMEDLIGYRLPETGSSTMLLLSTAGVICLVMSVKRKRGIV